MSLVDESEQFHTGFVVDDIEAVQKELTETFGYEWGPLVNAELVLYTPEGVNTYQHQLVYSTSQPYMELVLSHEGTVMQPTSSRLHHVGYWSEDITAATNGLEAAGWTQECWGVNEDGSLAWNYLIHPQGMRIELISKAMKPFMEQYMFLPAATG